MAMLNPMFIEIKEASAATWTTAEDITTKDNNLSSIKSVDYPRILRNVGFVGGAAAGAGPIVFKIGNEVCAQVYTSATSGLTREHLKPADSRLPQNSSMSAYLGAQSGTNAYLVAFDLDVDWQALAAAMSRSRGFQRRF